MDDSWNVRSRREDAPFLFTVDVEPDWGISGHAAVEQTLPRFCDMLGRLGVRATFFIVADLLTHCGAFLHQQIRSHEVASHGLTHRLLSSIPLDEARRELTESRRRLEDFFGRAVLGFRAPFLRTTPDWWAMLADAGYAYDSSMGALGPSFKNVRPARWRAQRHGGVFELPVTALRIGRFPFNLTYMRLLSPLSRWLTPEDGPLMFLHLHELADPGLMRALRLPLRWALRRNVGERAWQMLEAVLAARAGRSITCGEYVAALVTKSNGMGEVSM